MTIFTRNEHGGQCKLPFYLENPWRPATLLLDDSGTTERVTHCALPFYTCDNPQIVVGVALLTLCVLPRGAASPTSPVIHSQLSKYLPLYLTLLGPIWVTFEDVYTLFCNSSLLFFFRTPFTLDHNKITCTILWSLRPTRGLLQWVLIHPPGNNHITQTINWYVLPDMRWR